MLPAPLFGRPETLWRRVAASAQTALEAGPYAQRETIAAELKLGRGPITDFFLLLRHANGS